MLAACVLAAAVMPSWLVGQELRGRVVVADGLDQPVEGAVVTVIDPGTGLAIASRFTSELGTFAMSVDTAGTYLVRVDRIGYERLFSERVSLVTAAPTIIEFELPILPIRLADLDISVVKQCVDNPRDAAEVELVFDEARKALESQLLAQAMQLFRYHSVVFDRSLPARGDDLIDVKTFSADGVSQAPFRSLAAERLSEDGYIQEEGLTVYYYAPDATVLLSDTFQRDHCFSLDREERDGQVLVGLTFEPRDGRELPDISGALWLDEATNALDHLEFRYRNIPYRPVDDKRIGGIVEYGQLPDGAFIVRDWYIRMPDLVYYERREAYSIDGFSEYGAELRNVSEPEGGDLDWREGGSIEGTIVNSVTGSPLRDATLILDLPRGDDRIRHTGPRGEFFFDGLDPGEYELELRHPLLEVLDIDRPKVKLELAEGMRHRVEFDLPQPEAILADFCGRDNEGTALIVGRVRDRETLFPLGRARLWAEWTIERTSPEPGDNYGRVVVSSDDTRADRQGRYALCDIPIGIDVALQVSAQGGRNGARSVRTARLLNVADFLLDPPPE